MILFRGSSSIALAEGAVRESFRAFQGRVSDTAHYFSPVWIPQPQLGSNTREWALSSSKRNKRVMAAWLHQGVIEKMRRLAYLFLVGALLLSVGSGTASAQATASGTIQGTVMDKSGAVVSGAQVVAKSKATDLTRTTTSSDTGDYRFELLPVGNYTVTVTRTGFATFAQTIEILVGQTATVNAELKLGATSELIEVTSEAPVLDSTKTDVSQNITPKEVEELPMVGRDVANLAYLAPGVKATDSYDPTKNRYAILSVNGENGRNVNVTVNGVDNKDNTVGGPVMQLPLEAVQEFQISTQRF